MSKFETIEDAVEEFRNGVQEAPDTDEYIVENLPKLLTSIADQSYETGYREGGLSKENDWSNLAEEYPELLLQKVADQSKKELLESNQLIIDAVRMNPNTITLTVDGVERTYKLINTSL